jgi:hypothetical protein
MSVIPEPFNYYGTVIALVLLAALILLAAWVDD